MLEFCSNWFVKHANIPPIALVHGVFGAGKSYMLVVLVMFLSALLDAAGDDSKILVTSVTNVAVDNILQGLIQHGFTDFIRVGSAKRVSKAVLPFTISNDKGQEELNTDGISVHADDDADLIDEALQSKIDEMLASGKVKETVGDARVVGVTFAATSFEVLKNAEFPIVILDESSQCLEPMALIPMCKFLCQRIVAVGDPQQLPPTLTGAMNVAENPTTLEKTLFVRMKNAGHMPILLRTQYRVCCIGI